MQTESKHDYSGTDILVKIEEALPKYNRWIVKAIVSRASVNGSPRRVVDFGAGTGTLSSIFSSLTGVKPIGIELDPNLAAIMYQRGFTTHTSLACIPDQGADLIFTSNVLEHIQDDEGTLRELRAKIATDGVLAVYVPAFDLLWTSLDDSVGHYRRYTKQTLERKLLDSGFRVDHISYCDSAGFFVALLFKIIGRKGREPSAAALRFFDRFILPVSKLGDMLLHPFLGKNVMAVARVVDR